MADELKHPVESDPVFTRGEEARIAIATRPAQKADSALVGELLSHVEQVCGPLSTEATVLPGDDDRSVLAANFASILAALSDRDVVLEEAAKVADAGATWGLGISRAVNGEGHTYSIEKVREILNAVASDIRALKGGVDE